MEFWTILVIAVGLSMDAFAISVSHGLQYGVPLKSYVKAFINTSFAPAGVTDDAEIKMASSLVDYIFRRLAKTYLSLDDQLELGLVSLDDLEAEAMTHQASLLDETAAPEPVQTKIDIPEVSVPIDTAAKQEESISEVRPTVSSAETAPLCYSCGNITQRAGSCYVCTSCGTTSGCS